MRVFTGDLRMDEKPASSPFDGTAAYYARFRAPYATEGLDYLVEALHLGGAAYERKRAHGDSSSRVQ